MTDTITIDLPLPPSVNRIWRRKGKGFYLAAEYETWKKQADAFALYQKVLPAKFAIREYQLTILINEKKYGTRDLENHSKVCGDWLQRVKLIQNDKYCRRLVMEWAATKEGCRLILQPWS